MLDVINNFKLSIEGDLAKRNRVKNDMLIEKAKM